MTKRTESTQVQLTISLSEALFLSKVIAAFETTKAHRNMRDAQKNALDTIHRRLDDLVVLPEPV
jgi:hypothetical protein